MSDPNTATNGNIELKVYRGRAFRRAFWYVWLSRGGIPADLFIIDYVRFSADYRKGSVEAILPPTKVGGGGHTPVRP